jgi:hypothetical protein
MYLWCGDRSAFWSIAGDFTGHLDTSEIDERGMGDGLRIERVNIVQCAELSSFLIYD